MQWFVRGITLPKAHPILARLDHTSVCSFKNISLIQRQLAYMYMYIVEGGWEEPTGKIGTVPPSLNTGTWQQYPAADGSLPGTPVHPRDLKSKQKYSHCCVCSIYSESLKTERANYSSHKSTIIQAEFRILRHKMQICSVFHDPQDLTGCIEKIQG